MDGKYSANICDTRIINGRLFIKVEISTPSKPPTRTKKIDQWYKWIDYSEAVNHSEKIKKFDEGKP